MPLTLTFFSGAKIISFAGCFVLSLKLLNVLWIDDPEGLITVEGIEASKGVVTTDQYQVIGKPLLQICRHDVFSFQVV